MKIISRPSLQTRTRLGMGGNALAEIRIEHPGDWDHWARFWEREGGSFLVLGRGSNLLVRDGDLPLQLVCPPSGPEPEVRAHRARDCVVRVAAGFSLSRLLHWMQDRGLAGLEGLAGIPANVGGAVAMNAGSFGQCIGDCLHRVRCWSPQGGLIWLQREDVECNYRSFRPKGLKGPWIIHEVELYFSLAAKAWTQGRMDEVLRRKGQTQPVGAKTCGCTFKNPDQAPAGLLLDRCGMRGKRKGEVSFSLQHANFLLNQGSGCFAQAMELIGEAKSRVKDRFGVDLELEVQVVDPDLGLVGDTL